MNDRYLAEIYSITGITSKINLARCYLSVLKTLIRVKRYDAVLLEKEIFPFLPAFAEWWLNVRKVPYIVDYDDAIFHNYDRHGNRLVRIVLGNKIARVMRRAEAVVCGNAYLEAYARKACARRILQIPTVIDTIKYRGAAGRAEKTVCLPVDGESVSRELVIGWIGSPFSLKFLRNLRSVLEGLCARYPVRLHIVGGKEGIGLGDREIVWEWSEAAEVSLISAFDIGIMPLEDSPWEQGKCGYKLIQYMGCGLPVVGSPVGVNEEIIEEGVNGFKASTEAAWKAALACLLDSSSLRREMGERGRAMVAERYSLSVASKAWVKELQKRQSKQG
jgi:glycosyltransferase involved in cell wall biosynthesis